MNFQALHHQTQPLLIANVWDVCSAQDAKRAEYQALGTSSAAIAAMFGYEDDENKNFEELLFVVSRICATVDLPLNVDLEAGFGDTPQQVVDNIQLLAHLGVEGSNKQT